MKSSAVIVANGEFPKKGGASWRLLAAAKRVVCCDGAADAYRRRFRKWPAVIIGDLDSIVPSPLSATGTVTDDPPASSSRRERRRYGVTLVRIPDQDTNDLEKAMAYCAKQGWRNPVIVGATGKREDHTLGNVFRALDYDCEIVTDMGRFIPVCGKASLKVAKGTAVSIFAPDPKTRMTSKGLEWPLDTVRFRNLYCATLNRATASRVTLTCTKPVSVFIEERK